MKPLLWIGFTVASLFSSSRAWTVPPTHGSMSIFNTRWHHHQQQEQGQQRTCVLHMSDQWDDEPTTTPESASSTTPGEEETTSTELLSGSRWKIEGDEDSIKEFLGEKAETFDDATKAVLEEEQERELEAMGNSFIAGTETNSQEKWREMVKARTSSLGLEESQISKDAIEAAKARAAAQAGSGPMSDMLDLSQVTYDSPFAAKNKMEQLSIDYNPEDELTEEQMKRADPLAEESIWVQMLEELKTISFPDSSATINKMITLLVLGVISTYGVILTDSLVRDFFQSVGFLPTPEDIEIARENSMKLAQELTTNGASAPPLPTPGDLGLPADTGLDLPDLGL